MTKREQRKIALGAATAILRRYGYDPLAVPADMAVNCLEYAPGSTIAADWLKTATDSQIRLFHREWNKYRRKGHRT